MFPALKQLSNCNGKSPTAINQFELLKPSILKLSNFAILPTKVDVENQPRNIIDIERYWMNFPVIQSGS